MQAWETVINVAMMGTDKTAVNVDEIPESLAEVAAVINDNVTSDKEQRFLQLATLMLNYRKCGSLPPGKQINLQPAEAEQLGYCSQNALQVLKDIVAEESLPLMIFWLEHCSRTKQIVQPEMIPALLATATAQKRIRALVMGCCGKRGQWVASFNEAWKFSSSQTDEEIWQTGTPDQRRELFKQLRIAEPAKAAEWLLNAWPQEDANTKVIFLEAMKDTIGENDINFLESLVVEKGKKVKDTALQILKMIPQSSVVRSLQQVLGESLQIKKESTLPGNVNNTSIACKVPGQADENIFKNGIEKLSNKKELTDDEYIVFQLLQSVPPSFLEHHFDLTAQKVIELLQNDATGNKLIPALVESITRFRDTRWATAFMQYSEVFYIDVIPLLPPAQRDTYSNKYFDKYPNEIVSYATTDSNPWGTDLAYKIFEHASKNHYQYNRSFFNQHIALIPPSILPLLSKISPADEHQKSVWRNMSDYIVRLINMKTETIKAFNT